MIHYHTHTKKFQECVTKTHFNTIWQFCNEHDLVLKDGMAPLSVNRINDQFLMHAFWQAGHSAKNVKILNLCRQKLKISLLSDISTGDGKYLQPGWNNKKFTCEHNDDWDWPTSPPIKQKCWRLWQTAMINIFADSMFPGKHQLKELLGQWKKLPKRGSGIKA